MIPKVSTSAFIALVALLAGPLAQARTLKLSYEGKAKNIVHNLGKESNVVELSIGQDGKLPDNGANWNFELKPDGKRGPVKCHIEGIWSRSVYDVVEFKLNADPNTWVSPCERNNGFWVVCDPKNTCITKPPPPTAAPAVTRRT